MRSGNKREDLHCFQTRASASCDCCLLRDCKTTSKKCLVFWSEGNVVTLQFQVNRGFRVTCFWSSEVLHRRRLRPHFSIVVTLCPRRVPYRLLSQHQRSVSRDSSPCSRGSGPSGQPCSLRGPWASCTLASQGQPPRDLSFLLGSRFSLARDSRSCPPMPSPTCRYAHEWNWTGEVCDTMLHERKKFNFWLACDWRIRTLILNVLLKVTFLTILFISLVLGEIGKIPKMSC